MEICLAPFSGELKGELRLPGSKSISNRVLIIRSLCDSPFPIDGLSAADDTQRLLHLLDEYPDEMDAGPAGTTFRFLTALLAIRPGRQVLTGSERMKQRPIGLLVEALRQLGADIAYLEKEGFPPLRIQGFDPARQRQTRLSIPASTSSQFISALLLIAPALPRGLEIRLEGEVVSRPYIQMTLNIMGFFGAEWDWEGHQIRVAPGGYRGRPFRVESDWSAASYYYALAALAPAADLRLEQFVSDSLQGDAVLSELMVQFGIRTDFTGSGLRLRKSGGETPPDRFRYHFLECPDIAQTLAVVCAGLGVPAELGGLRTLRVKETDRIEALVRELAKLGVTARAEGDDKLFVEGKAHWSGETPLIRTYEDHRMAMAFAPLAALGPIRISDPKVVGKSYPSFWEDLQRLGLTPCRPSMPI